MTPPIPPVTAAEARRFAAADLVDPVRLDPTLRIDLRYATPDNLLHKKLYPIARCLLRRPVARMLVRAQALLRLQGYALLLWDCYRPVSVQREMWRAFPKPGYVANPDKGPPHCRGVAVDLTLVTLQGKPLEMPTAFDDLTPRAWHGAKTTALAAKHRAILAAAMTKAGFRRNPKEWWHWQAPLRSGVLDIPLGTAPAPDAGADSGGDGS